MARPTVPEMANHVRDLAARHDIIVSPPRRRGRAQSLRVAWEILIPPVKSEISYASALHEIGHLLGRFQNSPNIMVRERWAWRWAAANALGWSARMERDRQRCMAWYRENMRTVMAQKRAELREATTYCEANGGGYIEDERGNEFYIAANSAASALLGKPACVTGQRRSVTCVEHPLNGRSTGVGHPLAERPLRDQ